MFKNNFAYTTYQGGTKEGQELHPQVFEFIFNFFGFGSNNQNWGNYHDVIIENLSDFLFDLNNIAEPSHIKANQIFPDSIIDWL